MKEEKIIAWIGFYASLILANTVENKIPCLLLYIIAIIWLVRFWYLDSKK